MDIIPVVRNNHMLILRPLNSSNKIVIIKKTDCPSVSPMARAAANCSSSIMKALSIIPKLHGIDEPQKRAMILNVRPKNPNEIEQQPLQTTRRFAMGLASLTLFGNIGIGASVAEDNGFWLTSPIPIPTVKNKIANEETGTRSFIRNGIYIANTGTKGRMLRLKKSAFDLLALADLIGEDTLNYVKKYLRLKSTFMYYDFDEVITAASDDNKQPLTNLANRLFDKIEKLEDAVRRQNLPRIKSCYQDTTPILEEVIIKMPTKFSSIAQQN